MDYVVENQFKTQDKEDIKQKVTQIAETIIREKLKEREQG